MRLFNIEQIKETFGRQNYRYVGLFDSSGRVIIPFNPNKIKTADRLREIETRLISEALPDGYYVVKCKHSTSVNATPDEYTVYKGEKLSEPGTAPIIIEKPIFQPDVLTYESALKLQVDLERLKLENKALKEKVDDLQAELNERQELSESDEQPAAVNWIQQLSEMALPLLDKHFQLREQQLQLKAYELKNRIPARPPQKPAQKPEDNKKKIETCILSFSDDPDKYETLAYYYNKALNQEDFLHNVKTEENELFNEFMARYE